MKIIVAGAGTGGLVAAKLLAAKGHEVTIYEKEKENEVGYDWFDNVESKDAADIKINIPEGTLRSENINLLPPFSDNPFTIEIPKENRNWNIDRRKLIDGLIKEAVSKGAKIEYEMPVKKLVIKGDKVSGVIIDKDKYYADIVIDCCGLNSPLRKSFPDEFNITKELGELEYFSSYRAIFDYYPELTPPKQRKRVFIKFMGQQGVSWSSCYPDETVDIFVGKLGRMSRFEFETMLRQLRIENQIIGYELLRGGQFYKIPMRYPLTRMITDGYAAIGESAFMNSPLNGHDISNSMKAGKMLAETINSSNSHAARDLWQYQVHYFKEIGYQAFLADSTKRLLLTSRSEEVRFLFERGILTKEEITNITNGEGLSLSVSEIIDKLKRGKNKFKFVLNFVLTLRKGEQAMAAAKDIPVKYDSGRVASWQKKLDKFYE